MRSDSIVITGLGMQTSLGGAVQAAAAFRAGLSRLRTLRDFPYFDETFNEQQFVAGHPAGGALDGFRGAGRLLRLAGEALTDLRSSGALASVDFRSVGVFLCFSSAAPTADREGRAPEYVLRLFQAQEIPVLLSQVDVYFDGYVGLHLALTQARDGLRQGQFSHCLVGVADSLVDPMRLEEYVESGDVKTDDQPVGIEPGEAACFLLLETESSSRQRQAARLGVMHPTAFAVPSDIDGEPMPGEALSKAMAESLASVPDAHRTALSVYWNAAGTHAQALDIGHALARMRSTFDLDAWTTHFPATSFGDTGIASGPVAVGLALRAFARGYNHGETALIALASERPHRMALALTRLT